MFIQIHMLQSMPPGNLNRDETGQPKQCLFGGVTRGRISSQCLKRNIRHSLQFKGAYGDTLADRTKYLPQVVADALTLLQPDIVDDMAAIMKAIASEFRKKEPSKTEETSTDDEPKQDKGPVSDADSSGETGQLVFFQQPFAKKFAEVILELREKDNEVYLYFIGKPQKKYDKKGKSDMDRRLKPFLEQVAEASETVTIDIGLFGRMTTSDLVVNVEASCQVAHALSTHETLIESDYFTAMDDLKDKYAKTQTQKLGAAFLGSGDTETFFNSAVYYKYLNIDLDGLQKNLPNLSIEEAAYATGTLLLASAFATPTGKQNSFAAHSSPELILIEISKTKRPISYANAFLQPVELRADRNLMTESANALQEYIASIAIAYAPADTYRVLLVAGHATDLLKISHDRVTTIDDLASSVVDYLTTFKNTGELS